MTDSSAAFSLPPEERPLGIQRPLLLPTSLGQSMLQPKFLTPLGGRSLTVLNPSIFMAGQASLQADWKLPFQDSPFFDAPELPRSPTSTPSSPNLQTRPIDSATTDSHSPASPTREIAAETTAGIEGADPESAFVEFADPSSPAPSFTEPFVAETSFADAVNPSVQPPSRPDRPESAPQPNTLLPTTFSSPIAGSSTPSRAETIARRIDSARVDSTNLDLARVDPTNSDPTNLDSTNLDSTNLDSTNLDSTNLDSTNLDSITQTNAISTQPSIENLTPSGVESPIGASIPQSSATSSSSPIDRSRPETISAIPFPSVLQASAEVPQTASASTPFQSVSSDAVAKSLPNSLAETPTESLQENVSPDPQDPTSVIAETPVEPLGESFSPTGLDPKGLGLEADSSPELQLKSELFPSESEPESIATAFAEPAIAAGSESAVNPDLNATSATQSSAASFGEPTISTGSAPAVALDRKATPPDLRREETSLLRSSAPEDVGETIAQPNPELSPPEQTGTIDETSHSETSDLGLPPQSTTNSGDFAQTISTTSIASDIATKADSSNLSDTTIRAKPARSADGLVGSDGAILERSPGSTELPGADVFTEATPSIASDGSIETTSEATSSLAPDTTIAANPSIAADSKASSIALDTTIAANPSIAANSEASSTSPDTTTATKPSISADSTATAPISDPTSLSSSTIQASLEKPSEGFSDSNSEARIQAAPVDSLEEASFNEISGSSFATPAFTTTPDQVENHIPSLEPPADQNQSQAAETSKAEAIAPSESSNSQSNSSTGNTSTAETSQVVESATAEAIAPSESSNQIDPSTGNSSTSDISLSAIQSASTIVDPVMEPTDGQPTSINYPQSNDPEASPATLQAKGQSSSQTSLDPARGDVAATSNIDVTEATGTKQAIPETGNLGQQETSYIASIKTPRIDTESVISDISLINRKAALSSETQIDASVNDFENTETPEISTVFVSSSEPSTLSPSLSEIASESHIPESPVQRSEAISAETASAEAKTLENQRSDAAIVSSDPSIAEHPLASPIEADRPSDSSPSLINRALSAAETSQPESALPTTNLPEASLPSTDLSEDSSSQVSLTAPVDSLASQVSPTAPVDSLAADSQSFPASEREQPTSPASLELSPARSAFSTSELEHPTPTELSSTQSESSVQPTLQRREEPTPLQSAPIVPPPESATRLPSLSLDSESSVQPTLQRREETTPLQSAPIVPPPESATRLPSLSLDSESSVQPTLQRREETTPLQPTPIVPPPESTASLPSLSLDTADTVTSPDTQRAEPVIQPESAIAAPVVPSEEKAFASEESASTAFSQSPPTDFLSQTTQTERLLKSPTPPNAIDNAASLSSDEVSAQPSIARTEQPAIQRRMGTDDGLQPTESDHETIAESVNRQPSELPELPTTLQRLSVWEPLVQMQPLSSTIVPSQNRPFPNQSSAATTPLNQQNLLSRFSNSESPVSELSVSERSTSEPPLSEQLLPKQPFPDPPIARKPQKPDTQQSDRATSERASAPSEWSSIAELFESSVSSRSESQPTAYAESRSAVDPAPPRTNDSESPWLSEPELRSTEDSTMDGYSDLNLYSPQSAPPNIIQTFPETSAATTQPNTTAPSEHSADATASQPKATPEQFERLAQEVYRMVRQRLALERERSGPIYSGRLL